jgi:hypothetical protein
MADPTVCQGEDDRITFRIFARLANQLHRTTMRGRTQGNPGSQAVRGGGIVGLTIERLADDDDHATSVLVGTRRDPS